MKSIQACRASRGIEVDESLLAVVRDEESLEDDPVAFLPELEAQAGHLERVFVLEGPRLECDREALPVRFHVVSERLPEAG